MAERIDATGVATGNLTNQDWTLLEGPTGETVREAFSAIHVENVLRAWQALDDQVGRTKEPATRRRLASLRTSIVNELVRLHTDRLRGGALTRADAWPEWLESVAHAVSTFRVKYATALCSIDQWKPERSQILKEFAEGVHAMTQGRWVESYQTVRTLADIDHIPPSTRALLLVILGQIELLRLFRHESATQVIESAHRLAPDDGRVIAALGDCYVRAQKVDDGLALFHRAIALSPNSAPGYTGLGDYFAEKQQLDVAEQWYKRAVNAAIGDSVGCLRMLRLYGRREFFAERRGELQGLFDRIVAVAPDDEIQACAVMGDVFLDNDLPREADVWFERAINLDPKGPMGFLALAAAREKQKRFDDAAKAYKTAIEVAPNDYDGYFGLAFLYEQQELWEMALTTWQAFPQHVDEWTDFAIARTGAMLRKLNKLEAAEATLRGALVKGVNRKVATRSLEELADEYYSRGDRDSGRRIYDDLLKVLGDGYRATYLNRLGHLHLNDGQIMEAFSLFQEAIALDPNNAGLYRSLAEVSERKKQFSQAAAHYEKAHSIDGDTSRFNQRMALLRNLEGNDAYAAGDYLKATASYEAAIQYAPQDAVILSNLGSAYELAKRPEGRPLLEQAIAAYSRANEITPSPEFDLAIKRLRLKVKLNPVYGEQTLGAAQVVTPLAVEVARDLIPVMEGPNGTLSPEMADAVASLRTRLDSLLGVLVPGIRVRGNETDWPEGTYIISVGEVPVAVGSASPRDRFCIATKEELSEIGLTGNPGSDPASNRSGVWLVESDWARAEAHGLALLGAREFIIRDLERVVRQNLVELAGFDEIASIFSGEALDASVSLSSDPDKFIALLTVCRSLLAEEVPLRPFDKLWSEFNSLYMLGKPLEVIVEAVRQIPDIRDRLPGNSSDGELLLAGPAFQNVIANSLQLTGRHSLLAMEPEVCQEILTTVRNAVSETKAALVVDDSLLRPHARRLIDLEFPSVPVLSRGEVASKRSLAEARAIDLQEQVIRVGPPAELPLLPPLSSPLVQDADTYEGTTLGVTVSVSNDFIAQRSNADEGSLGSLLELMREGLFEELGLPIPLVSVVADNRLPIDTFSLAINGHTIPAVRGLAPDEFLVNDTPDRLALLSIEARSAVNPSTRAEAAIVRDTEYCDVCRQAGLTVWGPAGFIALTLSSHVRARASSFLTPDITRFILDSHRTLFPALGEIVLTRFTTEQIRALLKYLLDEEVSIRDLRSILTNMVLVNGATTVDLSKYVVFPLYSANLCFVTYARAPFIDDYAEFVRTALKRQISNKYARGGDTLVVYLLDPQIEETIGELGGKVTEADRARLLSAVRAEFINLPSLATKPVILTTLDLRRTLWKLIRDEFPDLAVVSYQELMPDMNIQPIARITWDPVPIPSFIYPVATVQPVGEARSSL